MIKHNKKAVLVLSMLLSACGGGGDSAAPEESAAVEPPVSYSASGKAIDGYLVGATAWLDINGNGARDEDEPWAETQAGGEYSLELTEAQSSCLPYATLYVDVPEGAVDETEGEVTAPYQLAFPPSLDPDKTENLLVTPLTTSVWNSVVVALTDAGFSLSCDELKSKEALRTLITRAVEDGIEGVVRHYNISADQIYQDYVAEGDQEVQQKAKAIVAGLQASLTETLKARQENPEADFVLVQYYMGSHLDGGWDYLPEQWYRDSRIWAGNSSTHRVTRISADFREEGAVIMSLESTIEVRENYSWIDASVWESRNGDGTYQCERSKSLDWDGYSVSTLFDLSAAVDEASCREGALDMIKTQYDFATYTEGGIDFTSQFSFAGFELNPLSGNIDDSKLAAFESAILALPYRWEDSGTGGAAVVSRSRTESFESGDIAQVRTLRVEYVDGSITWTRTTDYRDGTYLHECSGDGESWQSCNG